MAITINNIRRISLIALILVLLSMGAGLTLSILSSRTKEESEKIAVLEGIASGIAPSIWGYYSEMAATILDDFVVRERHPYLVILQSDGEVFYYHRVPPPGKSWLYRLGLRSVRSLELPVFHEDFPIAVVRTDYVSSRTVRNLTTAFVVILAGLLVFLIRRVIIISISRSIALKELEEAQSRLVVNDRMVFFSLLSMKLAHEFNTPLGIIITAQSFLAGNDVSALSTGEGRKMLNMIGDAATRMRSLIRRMQNSVPEGENEKPDAASIKDIVSGIIMTLRQEGDDIVIDVPESLRWNLRKKALELILEELITNASLHGRNADGTLNLVVSGSTDGGNLVVVLRDRGMGIPEHLENHVFSPFATARPMQKGSGLGLYLAMNNTVQFLNGSLSYAARQNGGAEFTLKIPDGTR